MSRPFARAVITCDHEGCKEIVELRATSSVGEATVAALFSVSRQVAEAVGWQCAVPGRPDKRKVLLSVPQEGFTKSLDRFAEGRDLCPAHREDTRQ